MSNSDNGPQTFPIQLPIAVLVAVPGAYLGLAAYVGLPGIDFSPAIAAAIFGIAIIGAALILSWAAEAAQVDINAGLAYDCERPTDLINWLT